MIFQSSRLLPIIFTVSLFGAVVGCSSSDSPTEASNTSQNQTPTPTVVLENPELQNHSLTGACSLPSGEKVVVGDLGFVAYHDGTRWQQMGTTIKQDLRDVWGSSMSNIYAVGDGGCVIHYDGTRWRSLAQQTGTTLFGVWGIGSEVWIVGFPHVLYYDGSTWTLQDPFPGNLVDIRDVWGSAADNVYIVGLHGNVALWNGTTWNSVDHGLSNGPLHSVGGTGPNDVFVGGLLEVLHYTGTWSRTALSGESVDAVHAFVIPAPNDVYAVGDAPALYHYDGSAWTQLGQSGISRFDNYTDGVMVDGALVVTGRTGARRYNGSSWDDANNSFETRSFEGVFTFSRDEAIAVGASGMIYHRDASGWTETTSPTTETLRDVLGFASDNVWAGGSGTTILHYDGIDWTLVDTPLDDMGRANDITKIVGSAPDNIFFVGWQGSPMWHYDGTNWTDRSAELSEAAGGFTLAIWTIGDNIWLAGNGVRHFNGSEWKLLRIQIPTFLVGGLWGTSASQLFLGALLGVAYWNGSNARLQLTTSHSPAGISGPPIAGSDASDVLTYFEHSLYHYNGDNWTRMFTNAMSPVQDISAGEDGTAYAVGLDGVIIRCE